MNASPKTTIKTANAPTQKLVHLLYLIPTPNVLFEKHLQRTKENFKIIYSNRFCSMTPGFFTHTSGILDLNSGSIL